VAGLADQVIATAARGAAQAHVVGNRSAAGSLSSWRRGFARSVTASAGGWAQRRRLPVDRAAFARLALIG
jgi:hypothetical protein